MLIYLCTVHYRIVKSSEQCPKTKYCSFLEQKSSKENADEARLTTASAPCLYRFLVHAKVLTDNSATPVVINPLETAEHVAESLTSDSELSSLHELAKRTVHW